MMFHEIATLEGRYAAVKAAGFKYVELAFPYKESTQKLKAAKESADLEQVLINAYPGEARLEQPSVIHIELQTRLGEINITVSIQAFDTVCNYWEMHS